MSVMAPIRSVTPLTPAVGPEKFQEGAKTPFELSFREHFLDHLLTTDEPTGICALRHKALSAFDAHRFPTRRNEAWKYISLSTLLNQSFTPLQTPAQLPDVTAHLLTESNGARLVFINGHYSAELSNSSALPADVILLDLVSAMKSYPDLASSLIDKNVSNDDAFALLNTVALKQGFLFHLPEGCVLETPVQIVYLTSSSDTQAETTNFRMLFSLSAKSKAEVIVQTVSDNSSKQALYFNNFVQDIVADKSAQLNLSWIQLEDKAAWQFSNARVHLQEAANVTINHIDIGATVARHSVSVQFAAQKAHCELNGLNVLKGKTEVYEHVVMDHAMPNNTSEQFYKSILDGQTKSEFNGTVKVAVDANGTDAHQLTKSLLLSEDARTFARPQLQILADDVKCNHGATVGQLEPTQLFYLKSRGLDPELAESMLMYGFAEEMIEKLPSASLQKYVNERLLGQLNTRF